MFLGRCLLFLCAALALLAPAAYAQSEPRLALLIGNAAYKSAPLVNPVNDVRLMEVVLKEVGFTVIKAENASIRDMRRLVRDFGDRLKASGGVGLFYFAGHGVQVRGENFLVSTDSDIRNEDEVADDAVNANVILEKMQGAGNRMNLIILDACRNNPFAVKSRSAVNGLATMSAPTGTLVAYATAPGSVAADGSGSNGLYTEHLAQAIMQSGVPVEDVFKQVRSAVRRASNNQQTPWENTALEGQFFFKPTVALAAAQPPVNAAGAGAATTTDAVAIELAYWETVKNSQRGDELQAYLTQFPGGRFAALARVRLDALRLAAPSSAKMAAPVATAAATTVSPTPAATSSRRVVGTLVTTDTLTKVRKRINVLVDETNPDRYVYSTGDVIDKQGRVLQLLIGDLVMRVVGGVMWTIPLRANTEGRAELVDDARTIRKEGSIDWKTVELADGRVQVQAFVRYYVDRTTGSWQATYTGSNHLPDSFAADIRTRSNEGVSNMVSAEFRLR